MFDDYKLSCSEAYGSVDDKGLTEDEIEDIKEEYCEECRKDHETYKCTRGRDMMGRDTDRLMQIHKDR